MGIPKIILLKIQREMYDTMRPSTIKIHGSEPTISDVSCPVVYSKYTTCDGSYIRYYATCRGFSHRNGRVAGVYRFASRME